MVHLESHGPVDVDAHSLLESIKNAFCHQGLIDARQGLTTVCDHPSVEVVMQDASDRCCREEPCARHRLAVVIFEGVHVPGPESLLVEPAPSEVSHAK